MVSDRMINSEPGLPNTNLDRTEEGGFTDQLNICFEGQTEVGQALNNAAVTSDKGNGTFLAGLERGDWYQVFVPGAAGRRCIFYQTG
jgi:hypothetical protein